MATKPEKKLHAGAQSAKPAAPTAAAKAADQARQSASPNPLPRVPGNGIQRPDARAQLEAGKLQQAEFARVTWTAVVEAGVQPDDVLKPEFWAHHSGLLTPWAKIEVRARDGSWYAEYIVTDCSRAWAIVKPIVGPIRLTTQDVSLTQASELEISERARGYKAEFVPGESWRVIRLKDDAVITRGKGSRDAAEGYIRAHVMHEMGKGLHPDEVVAG